MEEYMRIILAILALSIIIIIHEFGHFIVAKLSGIKVLEFSLFMGPKLFSVKRGETQYSLRLIPLGGFVKMEGEEQESDDERAFNKKPVPIRMAVVAAGAIANILSAIIILVIITSYTGYNTTKIAQINENMPGYSAGIRKGDKIVEYQGKKIYHPMEFEVFASMETSETVDVKIKRNGKIIEKTVKPQRYRYILGFTPKADKGPESNVIDEVGKDTPAEKAGLIQGDRIVKINDTSIESRQDINDYLNENKEKPVKVTVLRNGQELELNITPTKERYPEYYAMGIGFESAKGSFFGAVKNSCISAYSTARLVYYSIIWLVTGKVSVNQLSGPVGIVDYIGSSVQQGPTLMDKIIDLLNIMAFISINVGVMQLIPFPALDGSKILIYAIEGIRKKAIPPEKEAFITMVGFVLLVALMIFVTFNDTLRIFGKG